MGSIPACAGEPADSGVTPSPCWVYPRVCGGTLHIVLSPLYLSGLSPRVRGNLNRASTKYFCTPVYPRVCGGTVRAD